MKKLFLITLYVLSGNLAFAQATTAQNSVSDTISVTFNKVKPSFDNWGTAVLKATTQASTGMIVINFAVPNYIERFKTTLNDYSIIETETKQYKLLNQKELSPTKGTLNYNFTFVISKDELIEIVNSDLKKITFYFVPNEKFVKERLAEDKFMGNELKRHFGRVAKMTLKYKVSNPDEVQYDKFVAWLQKL